MYTSRLVAWFIWSRISTNCKLACFGNLASVVCENCKMGLFDLLLKQLSGYLAVVMIFPSLCFFDWNCDDHIIETGAAGGWHGTVMCSSTTQGRHLRHLLSTFHHCNLTPPPPPSVQDIRRKQFSLVSIACSLHCVDHQSKDTDEFLSQKLTIPKLKFCQPSVWYALNMCMYPGWVRKHIVREGLTLISTICVQSGNVSQRLTCAVSYAVRWHQPSFNICSCTLCTYTELYIITVLLAFIITCSTSAKIANLTIMTAGYLQGMLPMYFWTPMCFVCALYVKA